MANSSASDYSTQGSDEVPEIYCEQCNKHDNQYVTAEGFCVDCVEYLCNMCLKYHKRNSRLHTLQGKYTMPQDFCLEKCSSHKDEIVKFYCQKCEKLACSVCKTKNHRFCKSYVSHLPKFVKGIDQSKDLKDLIKSIDELLVDVEQTEEKVDTNIERVTAQETKVLTGMTKKKEEILSAYKIHQKGIIDQFEKEMEETIARLTSEMEETKARLTSEMEETIARLRSEIGQTTARLRKEKKELIEKQGRVEKWLQDEETEIQTKVRNTSDDDQKVLQLLKAKTSTMKTDLRSHASDLEQYQKTGQRCKLFVAMKTANENTEKLEHNLTKLNDNNVIHYYTVDSKLPGTRVTEHCDSYFSFKKIQNSEIKRTAHYHSCIQVNQYNTYIDHHLNKSCPQLCLLSANTLLMTDLRYLIILEHIREPSACEKVLKMDSPMGTAVKIDEKQVAVTFLHSNIIRVLTFQKEMNLADSRDIKAPAECESIAYSNDTLIVSTKSGNIHILDMSGKVLNTFDKYACGYIFLQPFPVTHHSENTIIYFSDEMRNAITSMILDGNVKAIYRDDRLSSPTQLTVDKSGAVFVCWSGSHMVQQLSSDLTPVKILLEKIAYPHSVAFCNKTDRLYVGTDMGTINVYELSVEKD